MNKASMYSQIAATTDPKGLSIRAVRSSELYLMELVDESLPWNKRCESGLAAITLLSAISQNLRDDVTTEELTILIKIFGQIIKSVNRYIRKEVDNLDKEFSGLGLILKIISTN